MLKNVFLIFCFIMFSTDLFGQNIDKYKSINWRVYHSLNWRDYIDYQSDEWKNMPINEKESLFQIPQAELDTITTDELIKACIDCFFCRSIGLYSSIDKYYEMIYNGFNGFRELLDRKDVAEKMIAYYKKMDISKESYSLAGLCTKEQVQIIEYLIVHPKILQSMNYINMSELITELKNKYKQKILKPEKYQEGDLITNMYSLAKILEVKDTITKNKLHRIEHIDMFLKSGLFLTKDAKTKIINIVNDSK